MLGKRVSGARLRRRLGAGNVWTVSFHPLDSTFSACGQRVPSLQRAHVSRTGGVHWKPSERLLPRRPPCSLALSSCSSPGPNFPLLSANLFRLVTRSRPCPALCAPRLRCRRGPDLLLGSLHPVLLFCHLHPDLFYGIPCQRSGPSRPLESLAPAPSGGAPRPLRPEGQESPGRKVLTDRLRRPPESLFCVYCILSGRLEGTWSARQSPNRTHDERPEAYIRGDVCEAFLRLG